MAEEMDEWEVWGWLEYFDWKDEQFEKREEEAESKAKVKRGEGAPPKTMGPQRERFVKGDESD